LTEQLKRSRTASARFVKRSQDLGLIKFVREIPNNNKGRPIRVYTKVSEEEFMR
jgi:predicted transcriptional regulator